MKTIRFILLGVLLLGAMLACGSFDLIPPYGGWLWVAFDDDEAGMWNHLYLINPTDGVVIKKLPECGVGGQIDYDAQEGRMAWGGGWLWATGVSEGYEPYWCEIDPKTGAAVELFDAPSGSCGGGIAWDGNQLWYTDLVNFYTINPEDNTYEWQFDTGWHGDEDAYHPNYGLAWDGNYLWSVGIQSKGTYHDICLYQYDVETNVEVRRVKIDFLKGTDNPGGLTYDGEAFWLTTWRDPPKIYRISPDGRSLGYIIPHWESGGVLVKPFAVAFEFPSE